jgi:hypothetical protein
MPIEISPLSRISASVSSFGGSSMGTPTRKSRTSPGLVARTVNQVTDVVTGATNMATGLASAAADAAADAAAGIANAARGVATGVADAATGVAGRVADAASGVGARFRRGARKRAKKSTKHALKVPVAKPARSKASAGKPARALKKVGPRRGGAR